MAAAGWVESLSDTWGPPMGFSRDSGQGFCNRPAAGAIPAHLQQFPALVTPHRGALPQRGANPPTRSMGVDGRTAQPRSHRVASRWARLAIPRGRALECAALEGASERTMKLQVRSQGGELTVPSQKEFLVLWQRGVIAPDDLVKRDGVERWVRAADLPWIHGMTTDARKDGRRLLWITVVLMIAGLGGVLYVQSTASSKARAAAPKPAVHAVPSR